MTTEKDVAAIMQDLHEINDFVKDRFDPALEEIRIVKDEQERLTAKIEEIVEADRKRRRDDVMRAAGDDYEPRVEEGPYAGLTPLELGLMRGFAHSQRRESFGPAWIAQVDEAHGQLAASLVNAPDRIEASSAGLESRIKRAYTFDKRFARRQFDEAVRPILGSWHRAAMDSTTAGTGDELVATLQARELWMDVNLETLVAPLIPTFPMPSNPFDVPRQLGDVNFFPGTENVAAGSTSLTTGRTTLTAYELVGIVPYSFSLEEDAIIAMLPEIRAGLVRNVAQILDDIILNADTTTANNINADGATIAKTDAGKGQWLLGYDGLIHLPLVDNTSQRNDHNAAVSDDMFNEIRAKLGKYGARPSELAWVMDVNTFIRSQSITAFRTMDKLGPNATLLTGMLGAIEGIPVIVSEQMLLTASDGKVTDGIAGTVGRLLLVNRSQWAQGFRREMTIDVDRDVQKRQTVVVVSFRHALSERSGTRSTATHTGLQFNITGV
jgi:HK97 family phage major capsid protein